jgi:hypothetical protein
MPVRAPRPNIRERLPSYPEPADRSPRAEDASPLGGDALPPRTDSPSTRSRPASAKLRASSRLAPLNRSAVSCDPSVVKAHDASDRRLPPESRRETVPRAFPVPDGNSRCPGTPRRLRRRAASGGLGASRHRKSASADRRRTRRGHSASTAPDAIGPLTPLSQLRRSTECLGAPSRSGLAWEKLPRPP